MLRGQGPLPNICLFEYLRQVLREERIPHYPRVPTDIAGAA